MNTLAHQHHVKDALKTHTSYKQHDPVRLLHMICIWPGGSIALDGLPMGIGRRVLIDRRRQHVHGVYVYTDTGIRRWVSELDNLSSRDNNVKFDNLFWHVVI